MLAPGVDVAWRIERRRRVERLAGDTVLAVGASANRQTA